MKKIILALAVILIATLACSTTSSSGSSGSSSSTEERLKQCLSIKDVVVVPDHTVTEVQGWIENRCGEDIRTIKIVATGSASAGGPAIGSDEEYIQDLASGDKGYFEALISDPNQEIKSARVVIDQILP